MTPVAWARRDYIRGTAIRLTAVWAVLTLGLAGSTWACFTGAFVITPKVLSGFAIAVPAAMLMGWVVSGYFLDLMKIQPILRIAHGRLVHVCEFKFNRPLSRVASISVEQMRSGRKIRIRMTDGAEELLDADLFEQAEWMATADGRFPLDSAR